MKVDTKRNIAMVSNRKGQVSIFDLSLVRLKYRPNSTESYVDEAGDKMQAQVGDKGS